MTPAYAETLTPGNISSSRELSSRCSFAGCVQAGKMLPLVRSMFRQWKRPRRRNNTTSISRPVEGIMIDSLLHSRYKYNRLESLTRCTKLLVRKSFLARRQRQIQSYIFLRNGAPLRKIFCGTGPRCGRFFTKRGPESSKKETDACVWPAHSSA